MNHGLINKFIYSQDNLTLEEIYSGYPELLRLKNYFQYVDRRDRYYIAMKYHAVHLAKRICPELFLTHIKEIINLSNHSSAYYYLYTYLPLEGHGEFIAKNFDRFIDNGIYPISTKNGTERKKYGLYKEATLDECRTSYPDDPPKEKRKVKEKEPRQTIKRSEKEKYPIYKP